MMNYRFNETAAQRGMNSGNVKEAIRCEAQKGVIETCDTGMMLPQFRAALQFCMLDFQRFQI